MLFGSYTYTERELSAIIATYLEVHVVNSQLSIPFKEFDSRLQEIFFFNPVLPFLLADKKKFLRLFLRLSMEQELMDT